MKTKHAFNENQKHKWTYACPCGCGNINSGTGTVQDYVSKITAALGSRQLHGVMLKHPKSFKKSWIFNLN